METDYAPRTHGDRRHTFPAIPPAGRGELRVGPRRAADMGERVLVAAELSIDDVDRRISDIEDAMAGPNDFVQQAAETLTREVDPGLILPFDSYRAVCDDHAKGFRQVGILSGENYQSACADSKTVFLEHEGTVVPLLASVEHEDGYDAERCKELTGKEVVLMMCIPPSYVRSREGAHVKMGESSIMEDSAIITETFGANDLTAYQDVLSSLGRVDRHEFLDPRLKPEAQPASMMLFELSVTPADTARDEQAPVEDFDKAWDIYKQNHAISQPNENFEGTYLFKAEELHQSVEVLNALWGISEVGFGDTLGKFHPVSMEESREFFDANLTALDTYTAVRYHAGQPVSFGSMVFGIDSCSWLNPESETIQSAKQRAEMNDEKLVYFSEIISNGERGARYSPDIINLLLEMISITQKDHRVLFESTNLSANYIPQIVTRCVESSSIAELKEPVRQIDELKYSYLTVSAAI
jgi:hypothetical protein